MSWSQLVLVDPGGAAETYMNSCDIVGSQLHAWRQVWGHRSSSKIAPDECASKRPLPHPHSTPPSHSAIRRECVKLPSDTLEELLAHLRADPHAHAPVVTLGKPPRLSVSLDGTEEEVTGHVCHGIWNGGGRTGNVVVWLV